MVLPLLRALNARPTTTFKLLLPPITYRVCSLIFNLAWEWTFFYVHESSIYYLMTVLKCLSASLNFDRFVKQVISPNLHPVGLKSVPIQTTHVVSTHCTNPDLKTRK